MDLHAPLGSRPPNRPRGPRLSLLVSGTVAAGLVALGSYYALTADPRGGEPYAVATIPPPPKPAPPQAAPSVPAGTDQTPTGTIPTDQSSNGDLVHMENGVKVVSPRAGDQASRRDPGPLVINVSKALDSNARKKAAGLAGPSPERSVPSSRFATTGGAPKPKVAIFVGGLGLAEGQAQTDIQSLPAAVSLAFVPYQANIAATVAAAKAKGHEVLLQLPMQSSQGTVSGPHTLRTTEPQAELAADLKWLTSRFDGYAGVTNLLGAPVTANANTMTIVLKSVTSRGAYYVDDGTSRRSLALTLGRSLGIPSLQADVVLDSTSDPAVVATNLERLVTIARTKGSAIGMASGLSDHLGAVGRFAQQLDARGLALVPVGEIARERTSLATSR